MNTPPLIQPCGVSLIGVPTDIGAGTLGARMGPDALRVAGLAQAIARLGREVKDCGKPLAKRGQWFSSLVRSRAVESTAV